MRVSTVSLMQKATAVPSLEPSLEPIKLQRAVVNQRAVEFLAGGAAVAFSLAVSLLWTLARELDIGNVAAAAVTWLVTLGWAACIINAVILGWCINDAMHERAAAHNVASTVQAAGFAVATLMLGGVMRDISLVSVYQKGEGNAAINGASVATAFSWAWAFVWICMRSWNDAHFARQRRFRE